MRTVGYIVGYRGVDTTNPFDVTPSAIHTVNAINAVVITPAAITTVTNGAVVADLFYLSSNELTAAGFPTGYTSRLEHYPYNDRNVFLADKTVATAGTETQDAATFVASAGPYSEYSITTLALRPTAAPPSIAIVSVTECRLGESFTVTIENGDLAAATAVTATLEGVDLGAATAVTTLTATFDMPSEGLQIKNNSSLTLEVTSA